MCVQCHRLFNRLPKQSLGFELWKPLRLFRTLWWRYWPLHCRLRVRQDGDLLSGRWVWHRTQSQLGIHAMTVCGLVIKEIIKIFRPKQYDRNFAEYFFKYLFLNENVWISDRILLKCIPESPIDNMKYNSISWDNGFASSSIIWSNDNTIHWFWYASLVPKLTSDMIKQNAGALHYREICFTLVPFTFINTETTNHVHVSELCENHWNCLALSDDIIGYCIIGGCNRSKLILDSRCGAYQNFLNFC